MSCQDGEKNSYLFSSPSLEWRVDPHVISRSTGKVEDLRVLILWDTSDSLDDAKKHEESLNFFFTFFNTFFRHQDLSWELAVVNTDSNYPLSFQIKKDETRGLSPLELANQFREGITLMKQEKTKNRGSERPFYNMLWFLDNNPSFLEPESIFVGIFVNDERDQTTAELLKERTFCQSASDCRLLKTDAIFEKFYAPVERGGYGKKENELRFHGVVHKDKKEGFATLIRRTNGVLEDVTKIGESNSLQPSVLQKVAFEVFNSFFDAKAILKKWPIVECIEVFYQGNPIPSQDHWFYRESSNSITFYNMSFLTDPESGRVEISYPIRNGIHRGDQCS